MLYWRNYIISINTVIAILYGLEEMNIKEFYK